MGYRAYSSLRPTNKAEARSGAKKRWAWGVHMYTCTRTLPSILPFLLLRERDEACREGQTSRVNNQPRLTASLLSSIGHREGPGTSGYRNTFIVHFHVAACFHVAAFGVAGFHLVCLHAVEGVVALGAPKTPRKSALTPWARERDARPQNETHPENNYRPQASSQRHG